MTADDIARYVVAKAVWAPSVHNTQPWRFTVEGQQVGLHADADRRLVMADPDGREMLISCGAALFNMRLALRSLGYTPVTCVLPDPGQPTWVAQVSWRQGAAADEFERRLFGHMLTRRTHRGAFGPEPLPSGLLTALRTGAVQEGTALRIVTDDGCRVALAAAVQTAERHQRLVSERVRELARWAPPPGSARSDGVPATSYPARAERTEPYFPGRDFAHGHRWGLPGFSFGAAARSAGVVCLLATADDRPADWVNAGQALQRVLLTCASCGVAAALHSQPLELPWLREYICAHWSEGTYPQLLLRLGTVPQAAASVRRPPASVLLPGESEPRGGGDD